MKHLPKSRTKPSPSGLPVFDFEAIGTHWRIEIGQPLDATHATAVEAAMHAHIELFDKRYSRFRPDSLIAEMSRKAGTYQLPPDAQPLFDLYRELYGLTAGAVTPLIGQVLSDAGYDASYSLQPKKLVSPPTWNDALTYDFPTLTTKQPVLLDVGAAGKGYLVDEIAALLREHDIHDCMINAGGDIFHHTDGQKSLRVGLEHPGDTTKVIGIATIHNQSICGSSGNRRAWQGYHHIMDPHTLRPVQDVTAVWVTAETTLLADALSTCLFFVSPKVLKTKYTFEYALLRTDYSLEHSLAFPAEFF
jgi:thiamine biosynthesis lipoprotein